MGAKKQGFITVHGVILLYVFLLFTSFITIKLRSQIVYGEQLSFAELKSIEYVKYQIKSKSFENQQMKYGKYDLYIEFYENECVIEVFLGQQVLFQSKLLYDKETGDLKGYEYFD